METNIIYNQDCLEGLRQLPDRCIDLVVTDPPYMLDMSGGCGLMKRKKEWKEELKGCGFIDGFNIQVMEEIARVCKKMNAYFFCNRLQIPMYLDFINRGGIYGTCLYGTRQMGCLL